MLVVFLSICQKLNLFGKLVAVLVLASTMACGEKMSEDFGWFVHDISWKHDYSLFGYTVYLLLMLVVYYVVTTKKPDSKGSGFVFMILKQVCFFFYLGMHLLLGSAT